MISLLVFIGWTAGWLQNTNILIWIPLGVLSVSIPQILYFLSTRENQYRKSGLYRIINNLVLQSASAILGWMLWGSTGLIVGMLIGQMAGALTLLVGNGKMLLKNAEKESWTTSLKEFKSYILYSTPQGLIETLQLSGTIFIIYALFDEPYPGLFYLCWRILQSPITLISNTIFVVHYNNASQLHSQQKDYHWLITKTAKLLFIVGGCIGCVLFFFGPPLFAFFLGEPWREAGEIARILSPWFVLQFAVTPFSFVAILENKQRTAFFISLIDIMVKGISLLVGSYLHSITIGLILYSLSGTLILLFTYFWYLKQSKKDF